MVPKAWIASRHLGAIAALAFGFQVSPIQAGIVTNDDMRAYIASLPQNAGASAHVEGSFAAKDDFGPASASVNGNSSGQLGYGPINGDYSLIGEADGTATANVSVSKGSIHAVLSATADAGWLYSPGTTSSFSASFNDFIWLSKDGTVTLSDYPYLTLTYHLDGSIQASTNAPAWSRAIAQTVYAGGNLSVHLAPTVGVPYDASFSAYVPDFQFSDQQPTIISNISLQVPLSAFGFTGFGGFTASMQGTSVTSCGASLLLIGNTLGLDSITLPDGTTPESHGYDIGFYSGITSPNLVPEPSAGTLGSVGAMAFISVVSCRRLIKNKREGRKTGQKRLPC